MRRGRKTSALAAAAFAAAAVWFARAPAAASPVQAVPYEESVEVVRRVAAVRLDPKRSAARGACERLAAGDLVVHLGASPVRVTDVERMPRPGVIWLLLDTSRSVEVVRNVVKRDAARVLREVAQPEGAQVALVTIDEDTRLLVAPTDDYDRVAAAIEEVPPGGQSFLRDGLVEILGQIAGDRREHLVLFWTDGADGLSVASPAEVESALARAPNARVVPIVFPALDGNSGQRILNSLFFELARRSGGDVFQTGGDWIERLRGSLARRWVVTVVPSDPATARAPLRVELPRRRCDVRVLDIAEGPGTLPETPESLEETWRRQRRHEDAPPCLPEREGDRPWRRPPQGEPHRIRGCALDLARERGILYRDRTWGRSEVLSRLELASRPWEIALPPIEELPRSPEEALDRLAHELAPEPDGGRDVLRRSPRLVHGRTLLALQGSIARAIWETQPEMRELARRLLSEEAERALPLAAAAIRIDMPALTRAQADAAARSSLEGRRLLAAATNPAPGDLRRTLAAWLGDVGARDLFERWERLMAERLLEGRLTARDAERRWANLRPHFSLPDRARTLALLVPSRDSGAGPVGFFRVLLPRAVWILGRLTDDPDVLPYDHIPARPMGLLALERALAREPALARPGARVVAVAYEPLVKAWKEDPARPFGRGTVRVTLAPGRGEGGAPTVIEAAFDSARGALPEIVSLAIL